MIDTRGFPQRTFLRDLDALDYYPKFIKLDADWKKLIGWRVPGKEKYFGEYLTQGYLEIEGHCCQVSMQQLIDTGLFKLCTFSDWENWANPVLDIRREAFSAEEIDHELVRLATSMGVVNMEPRFAFPFAAMLLLLHARDTKHESVRATFHAMFTEEELNAVDIIYDADVYETKIRMKEVDQFKTLVEAIRETNLKDSIEQISETFESLSVVGTAKSPIVKGQRRVVRRH
ncbi:hypothetical protein LB507_008710 [Fusarium sp. FIESC RH6]|nr:hypothetical protein LB507_008710 [Fusarium sp. FIESC RH6]